MLSPVAQFRRLQDQYYWRTALLIAKNQLSKQYRNSFLGILWTLIQPITMIVVYSVVMPLIMRFPQEDYILFIVSSLPLWTFIATSLVGSSGSILTQAETLKRCMLSSTIFPVADVLKHTYTYLVSFTVMYTVVAAFFVGFHPYVLLIPLYLIPVLVIVMSAAIAIAFLAPYVRDIGEAIQVSMNVLVWFTPVLYPITVLPGAMQAIMQWNPFYIMIHPVQMLAYEHALPSMGDTLKLLVLAGFAVAAGYSIYRACRRNYVYYL